MASGYALPQGAGNHHGHAHSHSYTGTYLSTPKSAFPTSNGSVRKAASNGSLYTHNEVSREPSPSPHHDDHVHDHHDHHDHHERCDSDSRPHSHSHAHSHPHGHSHGPSHSYALNQNAVAFAQNQSHQHHLSHSHSSSSMKGRARGESDLGRPAAMNGRIRKTTLDTIPAASSSWLSLPEALTSLLIPLPYLLASAVYSSTAGSGESEDPFPLSAYATLRESVLSESWGIHEPMRYHGSGLVDACTLTAGTLLSVGLLRKLSATVETSSSVKSSPVKPVSMLLRVCSVGLPFYASMQIGGMRVGLLLLVAVASSLTASSFTSRPTLHDWKHLLSGRIATLGAILMSFVADMLGLTISASFKDLILGYLALALAVFAVPFPLPSSTSPSDDLENVMAGAILAAVSLVAAYATSALGLINPPLLTFAMLSVAAMTSTILLGTPPSLRSQHKAGLGLGCLLTAGCAFLYSPALWPGTFCNGGLSALAFLAVLFDSRATSGEHPHAHHNHDHAHNSRSHSHSHTQHHHHAEGGRSALTKFLLSQVAPGSLMHGILSEKDSRRIAYFTTLNFGFMFVQGVYGYLSGSLGLLSDTVHMFFDCLALVVGLGAAVASKWPTSPEKPYGWGKLNTLAGFGNGIFLMLVSVEFVWEAVEGILDGKELRHVKELLVVSTLGLVVNMIGLFAFGHAHAGHDHGHSHGDHDHGHDHHNDNMHGIFLHVAADAGGSLAVIISTALTLWEPWYLWDPVAAIIIAILIFAAAVPLVVSSGQKLLLVVPDDLEYSIKNALQDLSELRGVVGYAAPKFWLDDKEDAADLHDHHHDHDHHSHDHHHTHEHDHHSHDHTHEHDHHHDHAHDHAPNRPGGKKVLGVIHIIAANNADLEDVRERVEEFVRERNMDLVLHVERESEGQCWCGTT